MHTAEFTKKLSKEITRKKDGRYLIYYTWETKQDNQKQPPRKRADQGVSLSCPN